MHFAQLKAVDPREVEAAQGTAGYPAGDGDGVYTVKHQSVRKNAAHCRLVSVRQSDRNNPSPLISIHSLTRKV